MVDPTKPDLKFFLDVDISDLTSAAIELRAKILQKAIAEDIQRGFVNIPYLVDKYSSDTDPSRSPEKTLELIKETFNIIKWRIAQQDIEFELVSYLTSNTEFQATLYKFRDELMKAAEGYEEIDSETNEVIVHKPSVRAMKHIRDIQRELRGLKLDRIGFLRDIELLPDPKALRRKNAPELESKEDKEKSKKQLQELVDESDQFLSDEAEILGDD